MLSLTFGLCAALAWGVHDICVRYVSQRGGILPALSTVLLFGVLFLIPVVAVTGGWEQMTRYGVQMSVLSGLFYALGCIGLYKGFSIGPVRLVAPIMGSYPILSVTWAALRGQAVPVDQWVAVGCIIGGVAVISMLSDDTESGGSKYAAIGWSALGAVGFALTFAIGHLAAQSGPELPAILITRCVTTLVVLALLLGARGVKRPERRALPVLAMMGALDAAALAIVIASGNLARPEFAAVAASTFGMITVLLAWAFLKERMSTGQWGGVFLTFAGIGYLAL